MSTVLEKAWAELDKVVDEIMTSTALQDEARRNQDVEASRRYGREILALKSLARGEALIISLFMSAYYPTYVEVSLEAAKRRAHRVRGEAYESPGLGARRFQKEVKDVTDTREG